MFKISYFLMFHTQLGKQPCVFVCVCVPGALAPFHWTTSSPVPGFDSRLRSVGGDSAEGDGAN